MSKLLKIKDYIILGLAMVGEFSEDVPGILSAQPFIRG